MGKILFNPTSCGPDAKGEFHAFCCQNRFLSSPMQLLLTIHVCWLSVNEDISFSPQWTTKGISKETPIPPSATQVDNF